MSKTLNQLRDEIYDWAKEKGWWDEPREFGTLLALCHSELSEALEAVRDGAPIAETTYRHDARYGPEFRTEFVVPVPLSMRGSVAIDENTGTSIGKPEGVPSELADEIIRILDICGHYGIDIERIVDEKMVYNGTRPHRHGGKTM